MNDFTLKNKTITLCGKRNCGKSYLLKYLVEEHKNEFKKIFCVCPTERINNFYSKSGLVKDDCIFDEYNEDWANKLIAEMTKINSGKSSKDANHVLLILDDCISDVNFHQSNSLKRIYTRSRHFFLSVIITTQYLYSIPPVCRNNSDYVLVGQLNRSSLGILCDEFCSGDVDKQEFMKMYSRATKDYGFFTINCNSVKDGANLNSIYGIAKTPIKNINV
jgi:hypothetical protein